MRNISEPRLMSQVGIVREDVCAYFVVSLQEEWWEVSVLVCLRNSCYHVTGAGAG